MSQINEESILKSIRKLIGPEDDYTHFDPDIVIHINSAINRLYQLGLDSAKDFMVTSEAETWADLFGSDEKVLNMCKPFIYFKVKMSFDPPTSSIAAEAIKAEIDKLEWLINIWLESNREG